MLQSGRGSEQEEGGFSIAVLESGVQVLEQNEIHSWLFNDEVRFLRAILIDVSPAYFLKKKKDRSGGYGMAVRSSGRNIDSRTRRVGRTTQQKTSVWCDIRDL